MRKPRDTKGKKCEPVGTLYEKNGPMFFRVNAGTASDSDGPVYEFSTNVSGGQPILRHLRTDRTFTLSWRDIITLAEANGIAERAKMEPRECPASVCPVSWKPDSARQVSR